MNEIILEKRYPHSREEDITDAFMRGYEMGKEQEHRWWSAFCANCKDENSSEKPNNCEDCKHWEHGAHSHYYCAKLAMRQECNYEPKDDPQTIAEDINRRVEMVKKEWNARHIEDEPQTDCPWK